MGYMKHHAIAVTSSGYDKANEKLKLVHDKAVALFGQLVSGIIDSVINQHKSFFVAPDGSKEFWETSDFYDTRRIELVEYIESFAHSDGSSPIRYALFFYGEDNNDAGIEKYN